MKWHKAGGTVEVEERREVVAVINPNGLRYIAQYMRHLGAFSVLWVLGRPQGEADLIARGWTIVKKGDTE